MTDLLEKGDRDGRREVNHETLCAVIQPQSLVRREFDSATAHNNLLPTIDHRRLQAAVPEQRLDAADVSAIGQQMGGE
jgi:hypothetical protein